MANVRAKTFEYSSSLDPDGAVRAEDGTPVEVPEGWTPENILLAALLRCITASLRHYAGPKGMTVTTTGAAHGTVTLREDVGMFGLVAASVQLDVTLEPAPPAEDVPKLLARAKAGCFVSNSLSVTPAFSFRVNGVAVEPAA